MAMEFEINQWAVHPRYGVGRIVRIVVKQFDSGPERRYYELEIPTGTVWVPVDGSSSTLRELIAKKDLAAYRTVLRSRPAALEPDHRQRQLALAERQKDGSFKARCELVRDLTALSWKRSLNEITSIMLQATRSAVCAEWATVLDLSIEKARLEVEALLLEGRKTYEQKG
jgi:RNA polymerase-interacting CarD/CdnL/TRCF family regulator